MGPHLFTRGIGEGNLILSQRFLIALSLVQEGCFVNLGRGGESIEIYFVSRPAGWRGTGAHITVSHGIFHQQRTIAIEWRWVSVEPIVACHNRCLSNDIAALELSQRQANTPCR